MQTTATSKFDVTPDPRVLVALTHTPLQPLDALCELIDNSIDSFNDAKRSGTPIDFPLVVVDLPGAAEVSRGSGVVRIRDNGPGLTAQQAENSIKAGYSGKKRFGSLGLFGMGFNIATGKLGQRTRLATATRNDSALSVEIDLPKIIEAGSYEVPVSYHDEIPDLAQGTRIEIDSWWSENNPNHGFIKKLAGYPKDTVRTELGRRYASILRQNHIRIVVNGDPCIPFEHCVWDRSRFVERVGHGRIPAQFVFDEVLATQTRCLDCDEIVTESTCRVCGSSSFRSVEERVRGWVGIQRFDDSRDFGVDLIRNGRALRTWEQSAFFEFTDEFKKTIKDYPIDSQFGRIVGEVHLDHVPVDFLKQDFQRSSDEWRRAIAFLRGESSLQPTQPNADSNVSPIFKLYQGYRRVRNPGTRDMYMGFFDGEKPKRISRDVERELYQKFDARLPGYFDDAEWWKLVQQAENPPPQDIVQCTNPDCGAQNILGTELCQICSTVLIGRECIQCSQLLPASAVSCGTCGASQLPEIVSPWQCGVCDAPNLHDAEQCLECSKPRGSLNPTARDFLLANSDREDDLSVAGFSLRLADSSMSTPIDVDVHVTRQALPARWQGDDLPAVSFRSANHIEIFIDKRHGLFEHLHVRPEVVVAQECAQFLLDMNQRLVASYPRQHSLSALVSEVLTQRFSSALDDNADAVKANGRSLFDGIRLMLSRLQAGSVDDLFSELSEDQQRFIVTSLLGHRRDLNDLPSITATSEFLRYIDETAIVDIFRKRPHLFFDGHVFAAAYAGISGPAAVVTSAQDQIRSLYQNCLEDLSRYLRQPSPSKLLTARARTSLDLLTSNFE